MAKVNISYNCGCGFRTTKIVEAILHADRFNHTLNSVGVIVKKKNKRR